MKEENPFKLMKIEIYQCPECEQWIYSRARHDMKYCKCGQFGVDGGHYSYDKEKKDVWVGERFVKHLPKRKIVELEITETELYNGWNESEHEWGVYE